MNSLKSRIALFLVGAMLTIVPSALGCPSSLLTNRLGDGRMYRCQLVGEDSYYCYYDCYE